MLLLSNLQTTRHVDVRLRRLKTTWRVESPLRRPVAAVSIGSRCQAKSECGFEKTRCEILIAPPQFAQQRDILINAHIGFIHFRVLT